jgi:2-polyprenyl-6-methoxyphenol hydroxylase-like FAD-dependent oxidoreductase
VYDAIIVGARCAGSPTAILLARKGYKVLLLDRDTFPSDIMSTHYIHQPGVLRLKRWGLLDKVVASNCPPMRAFYNDFGPVILEGSAPPIEDVDVAYCPRRTIIDTILVEAAVAAGAELRQGFSVQELTFDGAAVSGIRGRSHDGGATVSEQARVVIGADGVHSLVARVVKPEEYQVRPAMSCGYYSYWSGVDLDRPHLFFRDRLFLGFPTNDGLTCIGAQWPNAAFHEFRSDIEGNFYKTLEQVPWFAERVREGKREERFTGTADLPNFYRRPFGPGWALVGDAGYHKDPVTGQGITDAFRDAELLADALDAGWSGREPLEQALAGYEQKRNEASMPMYEFTLQQVAFEPPPPEQVALIAALAGNQEDTNRFFGLVAGTSSIPEFFSEENIGSIMAKAGMAAPAHH